MTDTTEALPPLPERDCKGCDGSGTIRTMTSHLGPDDYEFDQCCPACEGTGSADLRDAINALSYWTHKTDVERIVVERSAVLRIISARAALAQRQQVPVAPAMNIAGAASFPPSVGSGWVAACGCGGSEKYVDGKLIRSEYKCAAHAAAPALTAAPQAAEPERTDVAQEAPEWVRSFCSMESAPLDGTLVRLLVRFDNNAIEDTSEPTVTIGSHNDGEWNFVGWCWHTDEWARGSGDLLGWLPLYTAPQAAQAQPIADLRADFERECSDTDKLLTALGWSPENCRTDGGSLKLGMILEALEARDRLIRREAAQAQPQKPPRSAPLTEEQMAEIMRKLNEELSGTRGWGWIDVCRAIERAHGIGKQEG